FINVLGNRRRIDMAELTGRHITVYGQNEVVKDLIAARCDSGRPLTFEVSDVSVHDIESAEPKIRFRSRDEACELRSEFLAGGDGFHSLCRAATSYTHVLV